MPFAVSFVFFSGDSSHRVSTMVHIEGPVSSVDFGSDCSWFRARFLLNGGCTRKIELQLNWFLFSRAAQTRATASRHELGLYLRPDLAYALRG